MDKIWKKSIIGILVIVIAAVICVLCTKARPDRIYFLNCYSEYSIGDMILVESDGRFGLIDASNREADTIQDANEVTRLCKEEDGLSSSTVPYKNGRQQMQYLIDALKISHLDFVIATHSHSDHIGGIPEIAQMKGRSGKPLIDNNTLYFYKPYKAINEKNDYEWLNEAFYYQAAKSMKNCHAVMIDVSLGKTYKGIEYEKGSEADLYDDYLQFSFGNFMIRLYNLFSTPTDIDENVNSIVTVLSKGNQRICCTGDLNVDKRVEQKISAAIADDYPPAGIYGFRMSVVKAAHHGYSRWSNSMEQADLLRPQYVIRTGNSDAPVGAFACYKYYLEHQYGTVFYSVADSEYAIVVNVLSDQVEIGQMIGYGDAAKMSAVSVYDNPPANGWARWDQEYKTENAGPEDRSYYYFRNGAWIEDRWIELDGKTYYFKENGIMAENEWFNGFWFNANGSWTYQYKAYWKEDAKGKRFGDDSGWYAKNCTIRIDDQLRTFDKNGYLVK